MRGLVSITGFAFVAMVTSAFAADLPSAVAEPQFETPPPIPVFTWTGAYAGLHAGYAFGRDSGRVASPVVGTAVYAGSPAGIIGGAHAGYNVQTPAALDGKALVVGVEGDIDGADDRQRATLSGGFADDTVRTRSNLKGSIRARVGVAINRALIYATGGASFANFSTRVDGSATSGAGAVDNFQTTRVGYTLGGGVEYAFMNNYALRAEYRHDNYSASTASLTAAAPALAATVSHAATDNKLLAGISYKFDSVVPDPLGPPD